MNRASRSGARQWLCLAVVLAVQATGIGGPAALASNDDETSLNDKKGGTSYVLPPIPAEKNRAGLVRDTKYFVGYQFATIAILYTMPESVTNWSDEQKSNYSLSIWWDNVTHPQTDSDDLYLNYIVHPYWGAAYYVRAQERGYSRSGSFWYSVLCSSLYEFGAEALFEEASKQDLWITPIVGSAVGVGFMRLRDGVRIRSNARGFVSTGDQWIWVLTDPLGALNRTFDRWFGWNGDVSMRPYAVRQMGLTERLGRLEPSGMEWEAGILVTARW